MLAGAIGNTDLASSFLNNKAKIDRRDKLGNTALFWSMKFGHEGTASLLLQHDPDINIMNKNGETALKLAMGLGSLSQDSFTAGAMKDPPVLKTI